MRNTVRIGRIFGIDIDIDWSWLLIFLLVTWNLGAVFGDLHPGWTATLRWGVAVAGALLFFGSVLAHELAHSLMARAQGVPVRSITLFLFGGVSNIQREPPSPRAEFLITIVGPLTSFALGIIFILLSGLGLRQMMTGQADLTPALAGLGPVTTILLWLGPINLLLGAFNLIPGFPLDGGRVLRSALWSITGNLRRATRWASQVGQAVAWLLILAGVAMIFGAQIPFFGSGFVGGIWLAFIGWFLNNASIQSYRQVLLKDMLEGVTVGRMMRSQPPTVPATDTITALVHEYVLGTDDHAFPVMGNGRFVGLVTLEDIRGLDREAWPMTHVSDIMTAVEQLVTVGPDEPAADALQKLQERDVRQLPVVQDGQLLGLLRRRDVMRWLQLQGRAE